MREWREYSSRLRGVEGASRSRVAPSGRKTQKRGVLPYVGAAVGLVAVAILVAVAWWQRQPIQRVSFEGVHHVDTTELLALLPTAQRLHGQVDLEQWRAALQQHPLIASVDVYWSAPGVVQVAVQERDIVAALQVANGVRLLDATGAVLPVPSQWLLTQIPRVELPSEGTAARDAVLHLLRHVPRDSVAVIRWDEFCGWNVQLRNGTVLCIGDTGRVLSKWRQWLHFRRFAASDLPLWVDLRWRGVVVVRPLVQQETALQ
ncbi:MAG: FtsQ-type POTRA domain-containing protein [Candidatus Kapabacteria bacterium]|nr:FtsQ-type POTRA domain-containing protein [Candidatus Kapabacteria bacterium]MDW8012630.1 FtsQ-type POTRA domain-containing protein [Bacteroidota bacterium]